MRSTIILSVVLFAILSCTELTFAQSMGGSSSSGMFGNRTTGTGVTASTGSAFGSNSPLSSLGQSGGQGTPTLNNSNGVGGQARQANSFVGANTGQTAQRNFVGASQLNASGTGQNGAGNYGAGGMGGMGAGGMGGMGAGGMGGMGGFGMGAMLGRRMAQGGMGQNGNNSQTPQVRTTLTLADLSAGPTPAGSQIAAHLAVLPSLHWQVPAEVEMQGHTAILRGVVATEHERDLAERVMRLEPSVGEVQNLIVVANPTTPKTAAPAARASAANNPAGPALSPAAQAPVEAILPPLPNK